MNDTPGWASPGSAPSGGQEPGASGPAEPADRPGTTRPTDEQGSTQQDTGQQHPGAKWSTQQPPPSQWSAPTGPPSPGQAPPPPPPGPAWGHQPPTGPGAGYGGGYGAPGPGGYGAPGPGGYVGWGPGWGGPPPAAKPGVIPLRPLGVGEILDGAVSTMRTHWRTVLGISLTVAVVTQVLVVLLRGLVLDNRVDTEALNDPSATLSELTSAMGDAMLSSAVLFVVTLIGTITATALLTTVTSRAVLGKPVTIGEAWRDARPRLPRLFGLIFSLVLIALATGLAGVAPGILVSVVGSSEAGAALMVLGTLGSAVVVLWLVVRFSLASPALMLEKQGIGKSMSRSAKLVRGSWWRIFGIELLAMVIAYILAAIIVLPFTFLGAAMSDSGLSGFINTGGTGLGWTFLVISGIGSVIGSMITFPLSAGVAVLLYIDQRIRREALDLELARAAGVQSYGPTTPGTTPRS
ncbi:glycerophosphoryl diester phosphodiesterase membrane domain-containing protein [Streptomyces griseus]|uniref:glycerophosphoryl diester phosphodiesterase membrane domain-containing protein n=1 Tax=Streptomyces griseus TaxID=1911 RepID=UPI00055C6A2A|nr:membrane protein [Streptomyces griseus]